MINRLCKWCRSNPAIASLATALIVLTVSYTAVAAVCAVKMVQLTREKEELRQQLEELRKSSGSMAKPWVVSIQRIILGSSVPGAPPELAIEIQLAEQLPRDM